MTPKQSVLIAAVQAHIDVQAQAFTFDSAADLYSRAAVDQSLYFTLGHAFAGWVDDCWTVSDREVLLNAGTLPTEAELLAMLPVFNAEGLWPI